LAGGLILKDPASASSSSELSAGETETITSGNCVVVQLHGYQACSLTFTEGV